MAAKLVGLAKTRESKNARRVPDVRTIGNFDYYRLNSETFHGILRGIFSFMNNVKRSLPGVEKSQIFLIRDLRLSGSGFDKRQRRQTRRQ